MVQTSSLLQSTSLRRHPSLVGLIHLYTSLQVRIDKLSSPLLSIRKYKFISLKVIMGGWIRTLFQEFPFEGFGGPVYRPVVPLNLLSLNADRTHSNVISNYNQCPGIKFMAYGTFHSVWYFLINTLNM